MRTYITQLIREYVNRGGVGMKENAPALADYLREKLKERGCTDFEINCELTLYLYGQEALDKILAYNKEKPSSDATGPTESREPVAKDVSATPEGGNPPE